MGRNLFNEQVLWEVDFYSFLFAPPVLKRNFEGKYLGVLVLYDVDTYSPYYPAAEAWGTEQGGGGGRSEATTALRPPVNWGGPDFDFFALGSTQILSVQGLFLQRFLLFLLQWEQFSQFGLLQPSQLPQATHISAISGDIYLPKSAAM